MGFPTVDYSNFPMFLANACLKYRLPLPALQFVAKAVVALLEVAAVLITLHNTTAFMEHLSASRLCQDPPS